jgi:hypothetical protein
MYCYGDLPTDKDVQDPTLGPPPSWFRTLDPVVDPYFLDQAMYSPQFEGLGDRPEEIEVDPVEQLQELKFKQEMSKKIPMQALRYTDVEPLSPMFRRRKAKFGFGAAEKGKSLLTFAAIGLIIYFLFIKK